MTTLGPRTVTIAQLGGPDDGWTWPYRRDTRPMPLDLGTEEDGTYVLHGHDASTDTWHYRWVPPRTGIRHPCRAGDERGCPGARCPSHRQRQTA